MVAKEETSKWRLLSSTIEEFMSSRQVWCGTMSGLYDELLSINQELAESFKSAIRLSEGLNDSETILREAGIKFQRLRGNRSRIFLLWRVGNEEQAWEELERFKNLHKHRRTKAEAGARSKGDTLASHHVKVNAKTINRHEPVDSYQKFPQTYDNLEIRPKKLRRQMLALSEIERQLANVINFLPDASFAIDREGRVIAWNHVMEEMTGVKAEDILGKGNYEYSIPVYGIRRPMLADLVLQFSEKIKDGYFFIQRDKEAIVAQTTTPFMKGMGAFLWCKATPLYDLHGNVIGAVEFLRDITERKKMEILAGGMADEFRNILTIIIGNISLAKMGADPGDEVFKILTEAERASVQANHLTHHLLTLFSGGMPVKKAISVTELLKAASAHAWRSSRVRCEFSVPNDLWPVEVDKDQMCKVISNLIVDVYQAIPEGGTIQLHSENITVDKDYSLPLRAGEYIKISIKDQGISVPEGYLSKLFAPHFRATASGVGLATSYSIVKKHDGCITVESKLGAGTTVDIYLPASPRKVLLDEGLEMPPPGREWF